MTDELRCWRQALSREVMLMQVRCGIVWTPARRAAFSSSSGQALMTLDRIELDPQTIDDTLGTLLKYQDDIAKIQGSEAARILAEVKRELAAAG